MCHHKNRLADAISQSMIVMLDRETGRSLPFEVFHSQELDNTMAGFMEQELVGRYDCNTFDKWLVDQLISVILCRQNNVYFVDTCDGGERARRHDWSLLLWRPGRGVP